MEHIEEKIKTKAYELGFSLCGITSAQPLHLHRQRFMDWLENGCAAELTFLRNNIDKRFSAGTLIRGGNSIVCVALSYGKVVPQEGSECVVSSYACYEDYHVVIKKKLFALAEYMQSLSNQSAKFKACVDSVPIAERAYASLAGLGFIGKNTMLINPQIGSRMFLAELITSIKLKSDLPLKADCGKCRKCIEACPTGAITDGGIDCRKCISYLTIESRRQIPEQYKDLVKKNIFGCDRCVDVCPYNAKSQTILAPVIKAGYKAAEILQMNDRDHLQTFGNTPVARVSLEKLKSHIKSGNS